MRGSPGPTERSITRARRNGSPVSPATMRPRTAPVPVAGAGPFAEVSRGGAPGIPGRADIGPDGVPEGAVDGVGDGAAMPTDRAAARNREAWRVMVGWDLITPRRGKENSTCPTPNISWRPC